MLGVTWGGAHRPPLPGALIGEARPPVLYAVFLKSRYPVQARILNLLSMGMSYDQILEVTELSSDDLDKIVLS